ncbi:DUF6985 domain-containing protein [Priestia aryabhattai]|uniref:DUF6985 domain-containing protein n=1 Tax=Priestia aryabhattai TaxID=412384 RepID=UPI002E24D426|nr:DUF2004 domain-containing protein [Priestia aryabhattai]MED4258278.1 DUF2004 domain-containing protein [Priestia aryabhattai]
MTINDPIFGELEYEYGWVKNITICLFGKETQIILMIDGEEDGNFDENQYAAYQSFIKNWDNLQPSILQSIVDYYKQKQHELGYDSRLNEHYPLIKTANRILDMITLDGIVVPYADIFEGRDIRMTFHCTWDMENGLGIRLLNEKVVEVGYQDVAI